MYLCVQMADTVHDCLQIILFLLYLYKKLEYIFTFNLIGNSEIYLYMIHYAAIKNGVTEQSITSQTFLLIKGYNEVGH